MKLLKISMLLCLCSLISSYAHSMMRQDSFERHVRIIKNQIENGPFISPWLESGLEFEKQKEYGLARHHYREALLSEHPLAKDYAKILLMNVQKILDDQEESSKKKTCPK